MRWTPCLDCLHPRGRAAPERRSGEALLRCSPTRARIAAARDRVHSVRVPVLELPDPLRASSCYEFTVIRLLYKATASLSSADRSIASATAPAYKAGLAVGTLAAGVVGHVRGEKLMTGNRSILWARCARGRELIK